MRYFIYLLTAINTPLNAARKFSEKLFFNNTKAQTSLRALAWSLVLSFAVLAISTNSYAQTKTSAKVPLLQGKVHAVEEPILMLKKQLTYGQVLNLDKLADAVTWVINGPSGTVSGRGNALNDYVFAQPGDYQISLKENVSLDYGHVCQSHVPSRIELKVEAVKMTFHPEELKLSADIRKGIDTQGISMHIPVTIESFGEQKLDYAFQSVTTSGIDTHVVGTLKKGTVLKVGKQILQYELSGVANKQAYIQFDFTDINGQVQIAAPKKIVQ